LAWKRDPGFGEDETGTLLFILGLGISPIGALLSIFPGVCSGFGKLRGDVSIEEKSHFGFVPFTSVLIIRVILGLRFKLLAR